MKPRPVTLAEQLIAWQLWRAGQWPSVIARAIGRPLAETNAILFGRTLP